FDRSRCLVALRRTRQRKSFRGGDFFAGADERFDDPQGRSSFALGALAFEVGGKFPGRSQHFLVANVDFVIVVMTGFAAARGHDQYSRASHALEANGTSTKTDISRQIERRVGREPT